MDADMVSLRVADNAWARTWIPCGPGSVELWWCFLALVGDRLLPIVLHDI